MIVLLGNQKMFKCLPFCYYYTILYLQSISLQSGCKMSIAQENWQKLLSSDRCPKKSCLLLIFFCVGKITTTMSEEPKNNFPYCWISRKKGFQIGKKQTKNPRALEWLNDLLV